MQKFIVAVDGLKYSVSTYTTAVHLAKQSGAHLVGVFLEDMTYHSFKMYDLVGEEGASDEKISQLEEKDLKLRTSAVEKFERICKQAGVDYTIHHDRNIAINELLRESMFADMILINGNETLTHFAENKPTRFIRTLLSETQCPVMIIPDDCQPINKISFLYDGEASSVHAIRTFGYLFAGLKDKSCEVVTVNTKPKQKNQTPHSFLIREFMKRHFPAARYITLDGIPENELVKHFQYATDTLIVLGAYRRGNLSRWIRQSLADALMQELRLPLFISHS